MGDFTENLFYFIIKIFFMMFPKYEKSVEEGLKITCKEN